MPESVDPAGYALLAEDGDTLNVEDGQVFVTEDRPPDTAFNNYLAVSVGDGMGTTDRL